MYLLDLEDQCTTRITHELGEKYSFVNNCCISAKTLTCQPYDLFLLELDQLFHHRVDHRLILSGHRLSIFSNLLWFFMIIFSLITHHIVYRATG